MYVRACEVTKEGGTKHHAYGAHVEFTRNAQFKAT